MKCLHKKDHRLLRKVAGAQRYLEVAAGTLKELIKAKKKKTLPNSFNSSFERVSRTTSNSTYHWMLAPHSL